MKNYRWPLFIGAALVWTLALAADSKISALTAVVTPASTDEFVVNQGGVSKKETRAQIHALVSGEHLVLPQVDEVATPTLAFGDGDSGIYESADDTLRFSIAGVNRWFMTGSSLYAGTAGGPRLNDIAPSATQPNFYPNRTDSDSGVGWVSEDNPGIVCGGLSCARFEDPADLGATETSLWLYDFDGGSVTQVTVDVDDSCGMGFKCLRIAN